MLYRNSLKRFLDIVITVLLLIPLLPVMALVSVLVIVRDGRPVIFHQERIGLNSKKFTIKKFRTMSNTADARLVKDTDRLTPIGRFLRKTSLDELPNLFNILRGDMSLIGPRPLLPEYQPYYTEREKTRFTVRPGLSGLAQTNGRNSLSWDARLELDAVYVENLSLSSDIEIGLKTLKKVFTSEGVSEDPSLVETYLDEERRKRSSAN